MANKEKNEKLVKAWARHKYWQSSCVDEAIDWSNGITHFDANDMVDFLDWVTKLREIRQSLRGVLSPMEYEELKDLLLMV